MEAPSARYIITRTLFVIVAVFAVMSGYSFYKKKQRQSAILSELKSLASDSSYFQQFYAADAQKALVRAVGLIAEANKLGIPPEKAIDRGLGKEDKSVFDEKKEEEPSPREKIIRESLRTNYENFLKLGYTADFHTLDLMNDGRLPTIPSGPEATKTPEIGTIIPASASPGIEKVLANLEIRPPQEEQRPLTDIQIAAAKRLAYDLEDAKIIEEPVRDRILKSLTPPPPAAPDKK